MVITKLYYERWGHRHWKICCTWPWIKTNGTYASGDLLIKWKIHFYQGYHGRTYPPKFEKSQRKGHVHPIWKLSKFRSSNSKARGSLSSHFWLQKPQSKNTCNYTNCFQVWNQQFRWPKNKSASNIFSSYPPESLILRSLKGRIQELENCSRKFSRFKVRKHRSRNCLRIFPNCENSNENFSKYYFDDSNLKSWNL